MKPVDLRNATWRDVLGHLTEDLVRVHLAIQAHGRCTTRELAQKSGISIFTVRPRVTDLCKLGLVILVHNEGTVGIYAYRSREDAETSLHWTKEADFRRKAGDPVEPTRVGFITVEEAVASLTDAEKAALGARLMGQYGHGAKKREASAGATQLDLLTA